MCFRQRHALGENTCDSSKKHLRRDYSQNIRSEAPLTEYISKKIIMESPRMRRGRKMNKYLRKDNHLFVILFLSALVQIFPYQELCYSECIFIIMNIVYSLCKSVRCGLEGKQI